MFRIRANLNPPAARRVFHAKAVNRRGVVIADFLLLGVEAHALSDDGLVRFAGRAPDRERHLEAYD